MVLGIVNTVIIIRKNLCFSTDTHRDYFPDEADRDVSQVVSIEIEVGGTYQAVAVNKVSEREKNDSEKREDHFPPLQGVLKHEERVEQEISEEIQSRGYESCEMYGEGGGGGLELAILIPYSTKFSLVENFICVIVYL